MNFLSLFVLIPVLMLGGLLLASGHQTNSCSLCDRSFPPAASCRSTDGIVSGRKEQRKYGRNAFHRQQRVVCPVSYSLFGGGRRHFGRYVIIIFHYRIHRHIHFVEDGTLAPGILYVVLSVEYRCLRFFHLHRPLHHVYVL